MSFDSMPDLGPLLMRGAAEYAEKATAMSREVASSRRTLLDVPYAQDAFQKLDIYLPSSAKEGDRLPVLFFVHGGAWRHGHKEWMGFMAPRLLELPAIFVTPNYRLVPAHPFPAPLEDCLDALAWVYRNIAAHGGDPLRIFIGGHSAGGHIAALIAMRTELLQKRGLPPDAIKACFVQSASLSLDLSQVQPGSPRERIVRQILAREEDGPAGTVVNHVQDQGVPFFLSYGTEDLPNIPGENQQLKDVMTARGREVTTYVFDGLTHFETNLQCALPGSVWMRKVLSWMETTTPGADTRQLR